MANQKQLADHLDLSARHVRNLLKDGVLPPSKPGSKGYDLDACRLAYIRYLRGVSSGQVKAARDDERPDEGQNPREDLEYEKWREKKRENDIAEGLVAPVSLLTDAIVKTNAQVIPILESLPLEMKRMNPKLTGHDIQIVKKAIAKCRNAIADTKIEAS